MLPRVCTEDWGIEVMLKNPEHIYLADQTQEIRWRESFDAYRNVGLWISL